MALDRTNPPELSPPVGFTHVVTGQGRVVFLAGQAAQGVDGAIVGADVVAQFDQALANLGVALAAAGASPEHVAKMTIYCTDTGAYRSCLRDLGSVWRAHMGRDFPAITYVGVATLFDPAALVEIDAYALVPEGVG